MDGGTPRKYGIGDRAPRREDHRLLTGGGRYADDISLDGTLAGYVLRSPEAHGQLRAIDVETAKTMPGVHLVLIAQDLLDFGCTPIPCGLPFKGRDGSGIKVPTRYPLATDRVRFVGEPVAFVVADTLEQARDAAEAIELDIEPLPVQLDPWTATDHDAPLLHEETPNNLAIDWAGGDEEATSAAFKDAAHVTKLRIASQRVAPTSMEPRNGTGVWDPETQRYTMHTGGQGTFGMSRSLASLLGGEAGDVRVLINDVGGSFGMKGGAYPEHVLCLVAAKQTGRPVRWRDDRSESFLGDNAGRDIHVDGELALDAEGRITGLRMTGVANMGAFVTGVGPLPGTTNILKNGASLYRIPAAFVNMKCVVTNQTPIAAYRGAGRPDANLFTDRLVDQAARETGRDPVELRRLNLLSEDEMPYTAVSGQVYAEGEFEAVLDKAVEASDLAGFGARQKDSEAQGMIRGLGVASYLEATAPPGKEMAGLQFKEDGRVAFITGTLDYGQGHLGAYSQILSDTLGLPYDSIDLEQGDSDQLLFGGGTGGSRSTMASGKAAVEAAALVIENGKVAAGHLMEAATEDIEFADGAFRVAGTDKAIELRDLANRVRAGEVPTDGSAEAPENLDVSMVVETPPSAFPNGCHICEIVLDPDTGSITLDRYTAVSDFGVIVNPMLVEAQIHGGLTQGAGQVLLEEVRFDEDGQMQTGSFMDYCIPRATDLPAMGSMIVGDHPVPTETNPLGVKGCGEAGTTGAMPAVFNAVVDALAQRGVSGFQMPATPHKIWQLLNAA